MTSRKYSIKGISMPSFVFVFFLFVLLTFSIKVQAEVFSVGVVPQFNTKKIYQIWTPILSNIEERTGHTFILKGSEDIPSFEASLAKSEYDLAYMNPYHYIINPHYEPIVRDHGRQLYGILVVKKGGDIQSIQDLKDKTIHFPAPNALGASLMIRAELKNQFNLNFTPKYVKTHSSVFLNTALGLASAGGGVQKTLSRQKDQIKDKLLIIHETKKVTSHPLTIHQRVPKEIHLLIQQSLIDYASTEEGKRALRKVPFKQLGIARTIDYQSVAEMKLDTLYVTPESQSHHQGLESK